MRRGQDVEWSGIDTIDTTGLEATVERLLSRLPIGSWPKPRVHAAVSGDYAHVKTIHALPLTKDARALGRIVAATPSRFFVLLPGSVTVTGVRVLEDGVARAAVVSNDAIAAIHDACAANGLRVARVMPGEIALSSLGDQDRTDPCALGLGAILLDGREPIVIRGGRRAMAERTVGIARIALAASVALAAVMGSMTIPTLIARRHASTARREIALMASARARTLVVEHNLTESAQMLMTVSEFERGRSSATWLLHQLANALPAKAAIVSLKADSAAVTLSVLATSATDVLRRIQDMPGASRVQMIGAITYDGLAPPTNTSATLNSAGSGLERATIRFRLAPDPSDLRISLVKKPEEKK
jgi:hypothetical protein